MNGVLVRGVLGAIMLTVLGCGGKVASVGEPETGEHVIETFVPPPHHDPPYVEPAWPREPKAPPTCQSVALDASVRAEHVVLSSDRLVASVTADSVNDSVRGDLGLDHGKLYFEVTVAKAGDTYNGIGIATADQPMEDGFGLVAESCGYERSGSIICGDRVVSPSFERFTAYGAGATIGVAADLDTRRIWFSVDGAWQGGGNPSDGTGGFALPAGPRHTYYPVINISQGDVYKANFGNAPFKNGAPGGFASGWGNDCTATGSTIAPDTCFSLVNGRLARIDLATGETLMGPSVGGSSDDISSLGIVGDAVYFCQAGKVAHASLADGTTKSTQTACDAVTADANGIWVLTLGGNLSVYPDFGAVQAKGPSRVVSGALQASRLGPSSSGALGAWHSTSELVQISAGGALSALKLEGYDGWVFGVSAATGGRIIVSSPVDLGGQGGLVAFDAATGKNLGIVAKAPAGDLFGFHGLACGF